jgi:uncharacterized protein (TIRG00374 family)
LKPGLRKSLRNTLFLIISVALLWISFRGIDFSKLGEILRKADYLWLVAAIIVSVAAFFIRARRWIILMEPLGFKPSLRNTYHSLMTGYFANLIFPRLGEITRCAALGKKEKLPFDKLVGTVIVERTIDLLTVIVLLGVMLAAGSGATDSFLSQSVISPLSMKIASLFGSSTLIYLMILALALISVILYFALKKTLSRKPFFRKFYSFGDGIIDGLKSIASLKRKWEFILLTVLLWTAYLLMSFLPLFCLESTGGIGIYGALFILVIGSFGMAVPVQSGMGAFHWIVSRGLLVVYGIPLEEGLAYATLSHESQMLIVAILGSVSLFILFGRKSGKIFTIPEENKS